MQTAKESLLFNFFWHFKHTSLIDSHYLEFHEEIYKEVSYSHIQKRFLVYGFATDTLYVETYNNIHNRLKYSARNYYPIRDQIYPYGSFPFFHQTNNLFQHQLLLLLNEEYK